MLYLPRVLAVTFARGDPGATGSGTSGPTVPLSPVPIYGFRPLANLHALLIEAPLKMNIWQRFKGLSSIILCWAMIQVLLVKKVQNCKIFKPPPQKKTPPHIMVATCWGSGANWLPVANVLTLWAPHIVPSAAASNRVVHLFSNRHHSVVQMSSFWKK